MIQDPLPFPMTPCSNLPRRADFKEPIRWPEGAYHLPSREPGPYGVGPVIELPREYLGALRHMDRWEMETVRIWENAREAVDE